MNYELCDLGCGGLAQMRCECGLEICFACSERHIPACEDEREEQERQEIIDELLGDTL